jgi:transglutaminase-like putative cysteine protease
MENGIMPKSHWTKARAIQGVADELGVPVEYIQKTTKPMKLADLLEYESWHHTGGKGYFNETDFYRPNTKYVAEQTFPELAERAEGIILQRESPEAQALHLARRNARNIDYEPVNYRRMAKELSNTERHAESHALEGYKANLSYFLPELLTDSPYRDKLQEIARRRYNSAYAKTRDKYKNYGEEIYYNGDHRRYSTDNVYGAREVRNGTQVLLDSIDRYGDVSKQWVDIRSLPGNQAEVILGGQL